MKDYSKINKKWWNDVTPVHASSDLYDLKQFKKGKTSLQQIELRELGKVKGKKLLHLLCHFGMDTLSWAREGAIVTGSDLADDSIALANDLSSELKIPAEFICSDVYGLPKKLHKKFDIVFASYGVLCWLSDINKFAKVVNHFLKKGGVFYIVEVHPFTGILSYDFKLFYKYFEKGPFVDDSSGTYTDWNAKVKGKTYEWFHSLGDVVNAFIEEGFRIDFIHEFPYTMYDQFPGLMKKNAKGQFVLRNSRVEVPLLFSLKATKER